SRFILFGPSFLGPPPASPSIHRRGFSSSSGYFAVAVVGCSAGASSSFRLQRTIMPTYKIRGIDVDFPYDAYDCQIVYMEKVIQSLQENCNALLESPTGTGKTLCLLCATLGWRRNLGPFSTGIVATQSSSQVHDDSMVSSSQSSGTKLPMIIYASRTHSQIRQVVQELKRTNYRPKMVVLGSREQLCIHDDVRQLRGKAQTNACQHLRKRQRKHHCKHYSLVGDFVSKNPHLGNDPVDIEDLVNIGRTCGPCPYYLSRELHKVVDILFAPYNYFIDRGYRESLKIQWKDSILIFDEAHNLESICADAASFELPSALLTACIAEAKSCIDLSIKRRKVDNSNDKDGDPDNFAILRALLLKLEKRIADVQIDSSELGFTKPGPYIYELLGDLNVTSKTANKLTGIIEEAALLLEEDANGIGSNQTQGVKGRSCKLDSMGDILRIIFRDGGSSHARYYRVHVQESKFSGKVSRTLSWWCFNPGIAMEDFAREGVGSIILTSGTLSPMDSFAQELKLEFPVQLENPHVISSDQIWAGVIQTGPSGHSLNSSFKTRDSPEYKQDLGNAIVNFARIVPDGLLVFFPSYYLMDHCIDYWKSSVHINSASSSTVWERICKHKLPVVEPRQSSLFSASINDYMSKLNDSSTSGAIFFAVCRGKVSEGLDFSDHAGRAVIVTGLPFATRTDPKVRLKREYLDELVQSQKGGNKSLTGEEWYDQQASRAVNQAVGRVIRHRHDYGAILFCDERFASSHRQSQISRWIQPHIKPYSKYGDVVYSLTQFFRDRGAQCVKKCEPSRSAYKGNFGANSFPALDFVPASSSSPSDMEVEKKTSVLLSMSSASKTIKTFGGLADILPANRATLAKKRLSQSLTLKHGSNMQQNSERLLLNRTLLNSNSSPIVDLTVDSPLADKSKEVIAHCSSKRAKFLKPETSNTQSIVRGQMLTIDSKHAQVNLPSAANSIKEKPTLYGKITENVQCNSSTHVSSAINAHGRFPSKVDKSGREQEAQGSAFLVQVREKLTSAEYGEFVGYMKALKSKAMKMSSVMQSIVNLFSTAERLPLLRRFKDYIPQKYRPLYEQQCASAEDDVAMKKMDYVHYVQF
ncbi:hypothetical protein V2J09_019181, partial [Rumex salicifolius]